MRTLLILALATGPMLTACDPDTATTRDVTVTDSSGVEVVLNDAPDVDLDWGFERQFELGGAETGEEAFFMLSETGLAFDARGRIHVMDTGNRRVQVFDGAGTYVRTVGGPGDGPGEFDAPSSLSVDASGDLSVHDFGHRSVLRFDSTGTYVDQASAPRRVYGPIRLDEDGSVYATRARPSESEEWEFTMYRVMGEDTVELARVPLPSTRSIYYESCRVGISRSAVFDSPPAWDARGGRVVLNEAPRYSVRVFEGATEVRHVRRTQSPVPATAELAAAELGAGEAWTIGGRPCTVPADEVIEARGIAEFVPLVDQVAVEPDGTLWVRRDEIGEPGPIDIFDPTGRYVGTLPASSPWPAAFRDSGSFLALESDEFDVQRVVAYRLSRD